MKYIVMSYIILTCFACSSFAASDADIGKLSTYSTILGRGAACGIDTDSEARAVGRWFDKTFTGKQKSIMLMVFTAGMKMSAEEQASGESPDSCADVLRQWDSVNWP